MTEKTPAAVAQETVEVVKEVAKKTAPAVKRTGEKVAEAAPVVEETTTVTTRSVMEFVGKTSLRKKIIVGTAAAVVAVGVIVVVAKVRANRELIEEVVDQTAEVVKNAKDATKP